MANQYTPESTCTICGRRLSTYNEGKQCFFHSVKDRARNMDMDEHYHPVQFLDPRDGTPKLHISEGGAWRQVINRRGE